MASKMLMHRSKAANEISDSAKFGIKASIEDIDFEGMIKEVNENVAEDAEAIGSGVENVDNYDLYRAEASFVEDKVIEVDGEELTAEKILISAGSRPFIPPVEGVEDVDYLTSKDALELEEKPDSIVIVGGGYIAAEMAFFYSEMGVDVTIVERGEKLLKREDREIADKFTGLAHERYNVILEASAEKIEEKNDRKIAHLDNGETVKADEILMATGRRPNIDKLKLKENTSISVTDRGFIQTDKGLMTSVEGVFALGDIAENFMFKHSANYEASIVYKNMNGMDVEADFTAMPHAVFTKPQIAGVGKTEQELEEQERNYRKSVYNYENTGMGQALKEENGFVKVLAREDEILGAHIIGPEASTLIHEVLPVMRSGGGVSEIRDAIHIHPALSEVVGRAFDQL
jgi:dihydrolipoamide dehydrogenase